MFLKARSFIKKEETLAQTFYSEFCQIFKNTFWDRTLLVAASTNHVFIFGMTQPTQTSLIRIQDILKRSRRLTTKQDVVTTSERRHRIYDVLKMPDLHRLEEVQFTMSWRRLIYGVLKASKLQRLGNVWFTTSSERLIYDVLKTSDLRCLEDVQCTTSWRRLIYDVFKTSVKRSLCSNVERNDFFLFCTVWNI